MRRFFAALFNGPRGATGSVDVPGLLFGLTAIIMTVFGLIALFK